MRVTDWMAGAMLGADLQNVRTQLLQTQAQLASGHRITAPSDDPIGAENVVQWQQAIAQNEQYQANAKDGLAWLESSQAALQQAVALAQQVRTLAVGTSTGLLTAQEYQAIAQKVQALQASLMEVANTKVGDHYLFSGQQTGTAPFAQVGGTVTYVGGSGAIVREVSPGAVVQVNVDGNATFSPLFAAIGAILQDLVGGGNPANVANAATGDLAALDAALDTLTDAEGQIGASMQRLQQAQGYLTDLGIALQQLRSGTYDDDLAQSVVRLQQLQVALQSALAVGANLLQPSLLAYLH
jgi:flagellar hook-associated protein 3 FlgL